jgi:hypothetical protein
MSASNRTAPEVSSETGNEILEFDEQYTGAGIETERVERAYTWHKAKDKDCKESELGNWSGHTSLGVYGEYLREVVFLTKISKHDISLDNFKKTHIV